MWTSVVVHLLSFTSENHSASQGRTEWIYSASFRIIVHHMKHICVLLEALAHPGKVTQTANEVLKM